MWRTENNLALNTSQIKKFIVYFRRKKPELQSININGDCVERVSNFRVLGVHIDDNLSWKQTEVCFLRRPSKDSISWGLSERTNLVDKRLVSFYHCSTESVLRHCVSMWFSSCSSADKHFSQGHLHCLPAHLPNRHLQLLLPAASSGTHFFLETTCLKRCPLKGPTGTFNLGQTDWKTVYIPKLSWQWTLPGFDHTEQYKNSNINTIMCNNNYLQILCTIMFEVQS